MNKKILVITPVKHIEGVCDILNECGNVTYLDDPTYDEVKSCIQSYHAIYTNPNKSKVYISEEIINAGKKLEVICTASTGTNHIDKEYANKMNLPVLSLTEERDVINKISSTAEHAFALMMTSIRNIHLGFNSVLEGQWDYTNFIGRQINYLNIGVIGFGRLGHMFANYCKAFGADVMIYDPYKNATECGFKQCNDINILLERSDVISLHVHVNAETVKMINSKTLSKMKKKVILVNTSRGEIIDEKALIHFLEQNPFAKYATDVIDGEVKFKNKNESILIHYAMKNKNVLITPHIGGMTEEAQIIAYQHAAKKLKGFFYDNK